MDVADLLAKASDNLSVRRSFGTAYEKEDMLIIPVALVAGGAGAGTTRPARPDSAAQQDTLPDQAQRKEIAPQDNRPQPDTGGGFGGVVIPVGAYVVKGDHVRWVPAVDTTILALVALGALRLIARASRRRRR